MIKKKKLIDPDAGIVDYTYSGFGELKTQTDANGSIFTMSYDQLGRLTSKLSSIDGTTTYSYVSSGNGIGQILSICNNL